jgi:hypothetical protein
MIPLDFRRDDQTPRAVQHRQVERVVLEDNLPRRPTMVRDQLGERGDLDQILAIQHRGRPPGEQVVRPLVRVGTRETERSSRLDRDEVHAEGQPETVDLIRVQRWDYLQFGGGEFVFVGEGPCPTRQAIRQLGHMWIR